MQYHAIPCNTMQYYAMQCNTMQYHAIPCNTMQYHAIPSNTMQFHAILCNSMQYPAIPCIINNCWRSVPLPWGQYMAIFYYHFAQIIQIIISKRRAEIIWSWILFSLSLLLHQIFTLAKIFLPHMLLIKLRFPLCSLPIVKLFLALGICVFSKSSYIVLHPCTDYVLISCSRLPAASNI